MRARTTITNANIVKVSKEKPTKLIVLGRATKVINPKIIKETKNIFTR